MRHWMVYLLSLVVAVLVSRELALSVSILGVGPDLLVIVVVAFSASEQPRRAAVLGFVAGLVRDLLLATPKGLSAFAYAITGYGVAMAGQVRGVWAFMGLAAGATVVSHTVYGLLASLFSPNADASSLPRVVAAATLYNVLLAPLVMPPLRRLAAVQRPQEGGVVA